MCKIFCSHDNCDIVSFADKVICIVDSSVCATNITTSSKNYWNGDIVDFVGVLFNNISELAVINVISLAFCKIS